MPIYNAPFFKIDPKETRRYAGLNKAEKFDERSIIDACEDAQLLIDVRGIWNMYDYDFQNQIILSEPPVIIDGKSIGNHLDGCDKVVCLAITVGEKIEQEVTQRFKAGEYVFSMLLDAAATSAVEQAADSMEKAIFQEVSRNGYKMRWRFSPGYGDWSLMQQKDLFRLSGAEEIGMKLSIAMMMIPRKSITAIIGLAKNEIIDEKKINALNKCASCENIQCVMREI